MTVIALHLEYKSDRLPGVSGPGDTLRLAHALRHPDYKRETPILVTADKEDKFKGLLPSTRVFYIECGEKSSPTGIVNLSNLSEQLIRLIGNELYNSILVHAFIGREKYPWCGEGMSLNGHTVQRRRIDSSNQLNSKMFWSKWCPPYCADTHDEMVVAAFVRQKNVAEKQNTPQWYFSHIRAIASELGWSILWCGDAPQNIETEREKVFKHKEVRFIEQIMTLQRSAACAVGWNSGGLDLAAAAGLPVLRVGEFMGGELSGEARSVRESRKVWGKTYNSFLACAANIGLEPDCLCADSFPQTIFSNSLRAFLKHNHILYGPRHVILPVGESLSIDENCIRNQFRKYEVKWPSVCGA